MECHTQLGTIIESNYYLKHFLTFWVNCLLIMARCFCSFLIDLAPFYVVYYLFFTVTLFLRLSGWADGLSDSIFLSLSCSDKVCLHSILQKPTCEISRGILLFTFELIYRIELGLIFLPYQFMSHLLIYWIELNLT